MKDSVRAAFVTFSAPLEGVVPWLYLDVRGLVTIAIGVLVDPLPYALTLPLRRPDGSLADRGEIEAEWRWVKQHPDLARLGHRAAERATTLRLDAAGVDEVVGTKLATIAAELLQRFDGFADWPADAQLATLSMAWACGPAFRFPRLEQALRDRDFDAAARECTISEAGNPGVKPRNTANRLLYRNAAIVQGAHLDPDALYWPATVDINARTDEPVVIDGGTVHAMPVTEPRDYSGDDGPDAA